MKPSARRRASVLGAAVFFARLAAAGSAEGVPIDLTFQGCPAGLGPELERIARIELHAPPKGTGPKTQIALSCDGDEVGLAVDDPVTGKRLDRVVSVAGVSPRDRPRLLALAAAELVRSSWVELEVSPEPVLPLAHPAPVVPEQRERARAEAGLEPRRRSSFRAIAEIEVLEYPEVGRPLFGLSLGLQADLAPRWFVELDVGGWDGAGERSAGSVAVRQLAADPRVGAHLGPLDLFAGARLGWASLSGSPASKAFVGGTTSGFVGGLLAGASLHIVGPLRLWAELGGIVHGQSGAVSGDGSVTAGGFFVSGGPGVRLGP